MKLRPFGRHGFNVSEIGFGAWAIGGSWGPQSDEDSINALTAALDLGVNFIDTAAGYGGGKSERIIGKFLSDRGGEKVHVATKTPPNSGPWPPTAYCLTEDRFSESYIRGNLQERMDCLGTDKIDILQLHTWTRAWNRNPTPFQHLRKIQQEGKIGLIGISTPEHDQNAVNDLMKGGWVDSVQVIYNLFEQEPAAELLDIAGETGTGIIVRVAFDEGALTGRFTKDTIFPEGDFRNNYFAGDRLERAVNRAQAILDDIAGSGYSMAQTALKFALSHPAVSTVIPGMRNENQAKMNCAVSDLPDIPEDLLRTLHRHNWQRAFWHSGK